MEYRPVNDKCGFEMKCETLGAGVGREVPAGPKEVAPESMRISGAEEKGVLDAAQRRQSETLPGGRFPIPNGDVNHARNALARVNQAHGLSDADKAKVRARAESVLNKNKEK